MNTSVHEELEDHSDEDGEHCNTLQRSGRITIVDITHGDKIVQSLEITVKTVFFEREIILSTYVPVCTSHSLLHSSGEEICVEWSTASDSDIPATN